MPLAKAASTAGVGLHPEVETMPRERLAGRLVLVGTSAVGLLEIRATPLTGSIPGVEIHANMISGILSQRLKQQPAYMLGAEVLLLLAGGVVLSLLLPRLSAPWATLAAVSAGGLVTWLDFAVWSEADLVLPHPRITERAFVLAPLINGLGHWRGGQNFGNTAYNSRVLAWLTGGESLHNNHHAFPRSPKFSMRRSELDPSWIAIRVMAALRLAIVVGPPLRPRPSR